MQSRSGRVTRVVRMLAGVTVLVAVMAGCGIVRVSVSSSGVEADAGSSNVLGVTDDGRYSLFVSYADNLVSGDTNGNHDVFRRDTKTNTTVRVDVTSAGAQTSQGSYDGALSSDGRYAAFVTDAAIDPADTNGVVDLYERDLTGNTTTRLSIPPPGGFGPGGIQGPLLGHGFAISADHRYVSFLWQSVAAFPPPTTLYRRDLQTGVTTALGAGAYQGMFVSTDARHYVINDSCIQSGCHPRSVVLDTDGSGAGWPALPWADCASEYVDAMSGNGRYLVWRSAGGLPAPCLAAGFHVVDRKTGVATPLASLAAPDNGVVPIAPTVKGISRDGTALIFLTDGSFLPDGTVQQTDLYVRDLVRHTDARLNVTAAGIESNAGVFDAIISDIGQRAAFTSDASDLVANDHNGTFTDVFVRPVGVTPRP